MRITWAWLPGSSATCRRRMVRAATIVVNFVLVAAACERSDPGAGADGVAQNHAERAADAASAASTMAGSGGSWQPTETPARLERGLVATVLPPERLERLVARNSAPRVSLPESLLARRIEAWRALPVGERIARWAQLFARRTDNAYGFGLKPGGYVAESLLVQDFKFDCVLLFYRCTELARADSPREAVLDALGSRFRGGDALQVVSGMGGVDYDDPSHLDYSEDFAATVIWGRDVTDDVGVAVPDSVGTSRYPAGTRNFIPKDRIRMNHLRDGDLLFFVLDERHAAARKLRDEYGLLVGHQGIVRRDGDEVHVVHAAASPLAGVYEGNRVVDVSLRTYLDRLDRFKGIMVSRIEDVPTGVAPR